MLRALWFLLKLAAFVAAVVFLATSPGQVEIRWHGWDVRTSAGFLAGVLLVLLALYALLYKIWRGFADTPASLRRYRAAQKREQGYRDVTQGFVAVAAGDPHAAARHAARAEALIPGAPLSKLLSAQAHLLKGEGVRARKLFAELLEHESAAMLGLRGLLQETLRAGDHRAALEHIRSAHGLQPRRGWVVKNLFELETRHREWVRAEGALKKAEKLGVFTAPVARRHRQALLVARADEAEGAQARKLARQAFDLDPAFIPAALRLAKACEALGKRKEALAAIRKAWALNPHPDLGALWMKLAPPQKKGASPYDAGKDAYQWAKQLADLSPQHTASARLLGSAALEARQWAEARAQLTRAADYRGLAKLERAESGNEAKAREWLEILNEGPADPAWVCGHCGQASGEWTALCRRCHAFGTAEWSVPANAPANPPAMTGSAPQGLFIA
jgi:HemY protein